MNIISKYLNNMVPLRIKLENFMSHRFTDIDCSNLNSTLIVGKNKNDDRKSNGVGKTTIFHAVDFALFGEYPTSTIDKIVRDGQEFCRVCIDFETDGKIYRVIRKRNIRTSKSSLKLLKRSKDEWVPIDSRTQSHISAELANIIKINYKAFKQSVLFSQLDLTGLADAKSSDARRKILKSALTLEVYGKFEEIAKQKLKNVRTRLEELRRNASALGKPEDDIKLFKKELKALKSKIKSNLSSLDTKNKEIEKHKKRRTELELLSNSDLSGLEIEINQIKSGETKIKSLIFKINKDIDSRKKDLSNLVKEVKQNLVKLSKLNDELESINSSKPRDVKNISKDLIGAKEKESNETAQIKSLNHKADDLRAPMPDGDKCPHCKQQLSPKHREDCLKKASKELEKLDNLAYKNKQKLKKYTEVREKLEREISYVNSLKTRKESLLKETAINQDGILKDKSYISSLKTDLSRLNSDKESYVENLEIYTTKLTNLINKYNSSDLKTINKKIKDVSIVIKNLTGETKKYSDNVTFFSTEKGKLSERISFREKDKKELNRCTLEIDGLLDEYKVRQLIVKGFGTAGIPTMIIYTILDDLQIEANSRLNKLRPDLELQFKIIKDRKDGNQEDILEIFYKINGQDREYKQLSGGQKLIIALSLKLALASVIQKRLGIDIKFLELDEVDQSLDKAGVDAFVSIIRELQSEYKIFIITHNDYLKDKFENAILVENDGKNGSTAKLVTSW